MDYIGVNSWLNESGNAVPTLKIRQATTPDRASNSKLLREKGQTVVDPNKIPSRPAPAFTGDLHGLNELEDNS